jgi:hypothetical protein
MAIKRKSLFGRNTKPGNEPDAYVADPQEALTRAMRFAQKKTAPSQKLAKEAIEEILSLIERAVISIDGIQSALQSARSVLRAAETNGDDSQVPEHKSEYGAHLSALSAAVETGTIGRKNIINGTQTQFIVSLSDTGKSNFLILGSHLTQEGLALPSPDEVFGSMDELKSGIDCIGRAIEHVDHAAKTYCANALVLAKHYNAL